MTGVGMAPICHVKERWEKGNKSLSISKFHLNYACRWQWSCCQKRMAETNYPKTFGQCPPLPNCLEVCFHLHLLHKLYHLKLDIQWVLISFLLFFLVGGWLIISTLKIFQAPITIGLLYWSRSLGSSCPSVFCGCCQRIILFRALLVLPLGVSFRLPPEGGLVAVLQVCELVSLSKWNNPVPLLRGLSKVICLSQIDDAEFWLFKFLQENITLTLKYSIFLKVVTNNPHGWLSQKPWCWSFFPFVSCKAPFRWGLTGRNVWTPLGCSGFCRSDFDELSGHTLPFTMITGLLNWAKHCVCGRNITTNIIHSAIQPLPGNCASEHLPE